MGACHQDGLTVGRNITLTLTFSPLWGGEEPSSLLLRPLTNNLLYQPRIMDDDECGAVGGMPGRETKVLSENLPQYHLVHHKFHITRPWLKPRPPRWESHD
jgi:hypothetical protein